MFALPAPIARFREVVFFAGVPATAAAFGGTILGGGALIWAVFQDAPLVALVPIGVGAGLLVAALLIWFISRIRQPRVLLMTDPGPPFDDPKFWSPPDLAPTFAAVMDAMSSGEQLDTRRDPYGYAKKIRVVANARAALVDCRVTISDVPGGAKFLGWFPDLETARTVRPGSDHHYVVLPTGTFPYGEHVVTIEVDHADTYKEPDRYVATLEVRAFDFPVVTLRKAK